MPRQKINGSGGERRRRTENVQPKRNVPEVVYTQPKHFQRKKLLLQLLTMFAVVLAVSMGVSIFFKVDTVLVTGAEKYSVETIRDKSDIQEGESLLFLRRPSVAGKILDALPYVKNVRIGISLPGTVNIIIEEVPLVYSVEAADGSLWLMTSEGRITEQADDAAADQYPTVAGFRLASPAAGQQAVAAEPAQGGETPAHPEVITAADKLKISLMVLQQLEMNEVLGEVTRVDVTNLQDLQIWYGDRYQVKLGNEQRLDYKIAAAKQAVAQMGQRQTGVLDASFTTFPDKIHYQPFE